MGVKIKTSEGLTILPTGPEILAKQREQLASYMPLAGGTFSGEIQIPAKSNFTLIDMRNTYPATEAQLVSSANYVLEEVNRLYSLKAHSHNLATQKLSGFMSLEDKVKLDSIQTGAQVTIAYVDTLPDTVDENSYPFIVAPDID